MNDIATSKNGRRKGAGVLRKTTSLWGTPPTRYYSLLRRVECEIPERPLSLTVVGCSDGKFVLPAARRGYRVLACDFDEVAINGGEKIGPSGPTHMPGLRTRLQQENLTSQVDVFVGDFMDISPDATTWLVWTSGALQYSLNQKHSMDAMVARLLAMVKPGGFFYADYMLPMETPYIGRDNYPGRERWSQFFGQQWHVVHNRVLPPQFEAAHVDLPIDHYHHWGHILARRLV